MESVMSLRKRSLQLFQCVINTQNFPCLMIVKFCFSIWRKSLQFKGIAPGFKIRALVNMEDYCKYNIKTFEAFLEKKNYCCEESLCSIYNESSLQRAISYIAETSKCNLNYASSYQLYIEDSLWIEQSSMSCDSSHCIELHTLVAFCQPNGTVKLKE